MITDLKAIYDAYLECGSNITKTAKELGMDRGTVRRKLRQYQAEESPESVFERECKATNTPIDDVAAYWIKTDEASIYVKRPDGPSYMEIRDKLIEEMIKYSPEYAPVWRAAQPGKKHLLVVDPADVHIGKLVDSYSCGDSYDIEKAVKQLRDGVVALVDRAKGFNIDRVILVVGNDILHVDNINNTTTKGTRQDTHGKFWHMYLAAKLAYIKIIEYITQHVANVTVVFNPSNHDYTSGWMLADTLVSWFNKNPNVSFGDKNSLADMRHRKYVLYGNNLIGFTHGDGASEKDLVGLMQHEAREAWGKSRFAYMYVHHLHHKIRNAYTPAMVKMEKDYTGITVLHTGLATNPGQTTYVETVRSPSPPDEYHAKFGYVNMQAIEAFIHCAERGQVARLTEYF